MPKDPNLAALEAHADRLKQFGQSSNGALRESIGGKIDTTLVPYELVVQAAIGLLYGERKYSARNFVKGFELRDLCGSIERHNKALLDGEAIDEDSGLPHLSLLASSVAMLCHNMMQGRLIPSTRPSKEGLSVAEISKTAQYTLQECLRKKEE